MVVESGAIERVHREVWFQAATVVAVASFSPTVEPDSAAASSHSTRGVYAPRVPLRASTTYSGMLHEIGINKFVEDYLIQRVCVEHSA